MNNLHKNVTKWCKEWELNELNDSLIESIEQSAKQMTDPYLQNKWQTCNLNGSEAQNVTLEQF